MIKRIFSGMRQVLILHHSGEQLELYLPREGRKMIGIDVPDDCCIRQYEDADRDRYLALMRRAGFSEWEDGVLRQAVSLCVPQGFFVVVERSSQNIMATMMARHMSDMDHPCRGRIDWLAADPAFAGRRLGRIAAAAATNRLLEIRYSDIVVTTDDHRLPAIKTFLDLGYVPSIKNQSLRDRWVVVFQKLKMPFPLS